MVNCTIPCDTSTAVATWLYVYQEQLIYKISYIAREAICVKMRRILRWPYFSVSFMAMFSVYHEKYTRSLGNFNTCN